MLDANKDATTHRVGIIIDPDDGRQNKVLQDIEETDWTFITEQLIAKEPVYASIIRPKSSSPDSEKIERQNTLSDSLIEVLENGPVDKPWKDPDEHTYQEIRDDSVNIFIPNEVKLEAYSAQKQALDNVDIFIEENHLDDEEPDQKLDIPNEDIELRNAWNIFHDSSLLSDEINFYSEEDISSENSWNVAKKLSLSSSNNDWPSAQERHPHEAENYQHDYEDVPEVQKSTEILIPDQEYKDEQSATEYVQPEDVEDTPNIISYREGIVIDVGQKITNFRVGLVVGNNMSSTETQTLCLQKEIKDTENRRSLVKNVLKEQGINVDEFFYTGTDVVTAKDNRHETYSSYDSWIDKTASTTGVQLEERGSLDRYQLPDDIEELAKDANDRTSDSETEADVCPVPDALQLVKKELVDSCDPEPKDIPRTEAKLQQEESATHYQGPEKIGPKKEYPPVAEAIRRGDILKETEGKSDPATSDKNRVNTPEGSKTEQSSILELKESGARYQIPDKWNLQKQPQQETVQQSSPQSDFSVEHKENLDRYQLPEVSVRPGPILTKPKQILPLDTQPDNKPSQRDHYTSYLAHLQQEAKPRTDRPGPESTNKEITDCIQDPYPINDSYEPLHTHLTEGRVTEVIYSNTTEKVILPEDQNLPMDPRITKPTDSNRMSSSQTEKGQFDQFEWETNKFENAPQKLDDTSVSTFSGNEKVLGEFSGNEENLSNGIFAKDRTDLSHVLPDTLKQGTTTEQLPSSMNHTSNSEPIKSVLNDTDKGLEPKTAEQVAQTDVPTNSPMAAARKTSKTEPVFFTFDQPDKVFRTVLQKAATVGLPSEVTLEVMRPQNRVRFDEIKIVPDTETVRLVDRKSLVSQTNKLKRLKLRFIPLESGPCSLKIQSSKDTFPEETILVEAEGNNPILSFSDSEEFPLHIACNMNDGSVYVAYPHHVSKFSQNGEFLRDIIWDPDVYFNDIAVDECSYVAAGVSSWDNEAKQKRHNQEVRLYDIFGMLQWSVGAPPAFNSEVVCHVTFDWHGNVLFSFRRNISRCARLIGDLDMSSTIPGLGMVNRLAVSPHGEIVVLDGVTRQLIILDCKLNLLRNINLEPAVGPVENAGDPIECGYSGLCVDRAGNIVVSDCRRDTVDIYKPDGTRLGWLESDWDQVRWPLSVAVSKSGFLFVVDHRNGCVKKFKYLTS